MDTNDIRSGYVSLGADINKRPVGGDNEETKEGLVGEKMPTLQLDMPNEDILELTKKWKKKWKDSDKREVWETQCEENEKYWKGKQYSGPKSDKSRAMVDNLIFESVETYLPQVTRRNPEPLVTLSSREQSSPEVEAYIQHLKNTLGDIADEIKLRLRLKRSGKYWAIYLLSVVKFGWDPKKELPVVRVLRPQKTILDPDATVDEDGYSGDYVGEYRQMSGQRMLSIIDDINGSSGMSLPKSMPPKEDESMEGESMSSESKTDSSGVEKLRKAIGENKGTQVKFIEWNTAEYFCWEYEGDIVLKGKNPNWNYEQSMPKVIVNDMGQESVQEEMMPGVNHFTAPRLPYVFLSVFNLGEQPMDDTGLITQNLSNQDLINKRNKQITKSVDGMNGGVVVSEERSGLSASQAKGVTAALEKGGTVIIPTGAPSDAITRMPSVPLPGDVYNQLQDTRNRLRDIFGTRGSAPAGNESTQTVRGKIINRTADTDRIGGGVSEYLEQHADDIYNWIVQLLYVYDKNFQFTQGKLPPKVKISVKEGSLLPKDSTTLANQAIDLASGGKMALIDLYKRLEYSNPEEMAVNAWLEVNAPELLYQNDPRVAQAMQMRQQQAMAMEQSKNATAEKPPSMSMSYKDLPPEGQAQMAAKAGIQVTPESAMAASVPPATQQKPGDNGSLANVGMGGG